MRRDYGLCLWTFGDVSFEEKCKLAKEIGVDGVEVQGDLSQDPKELKGTLKKHGLKVLSITPDNVDISSDNQQVRSEAVQYFLELLDWANELGAKRICLHGDVGKTQGSSDEERDWELLVKSSTTILEKAETLGVEVVFEVLNRYENHQVVTGKEALKLVNEVGSRNLLVLLDAYHMNIEESCPIRALKEMKGYLGVYHVADSNRQGVGEGHADIKGQIEVLHEIGFTGPIIMEMVAEGPNPFTPVKHENYLEEVKGHYINSLMKIKEWDQMKVGI